MKRFCMMIVLLVLTIGRMDAQADPTTGKLPRRIIVVDTTTNADSQKVVVSSATKPKMAPAKSAVRLSPKAGVPAVGTTTTLPEKRPNFTSSASQVEPVKAPEEALARSGVSRQSTEYQCQLVSGEVVTLTNPIDCAKFPTPSVTPVERGWWERNWKSVAVTTGVVGTVAFLIWGKPLFRNSADAFAYAGVP